MSPAELTRVETWLKESNFTAARSLLMELLQADPRNEEARHTLIRTYLCQGDQEALAEATRQLSLLLSLRSS